MASMPELTFLRILLEGRVAKARNTYKRSKKEQDLQILATVLWDAPLAFYDLADRIR